MNHKARVFSDPGKGTWIASYPRMFRGPAFVVASIASTMGACLLVPRSAEAQTWPADAQWLALTKGGAPIVDSDTDQPNDSIDIVGSATLPRRMCLATPVTCFSAAFGRNPVNQSKRDQIVWLGLEVDTDKNLKNPMNFCRSSTAYH